MVFPTPLFHPKMSHTPWCAMNLSMLITNSDVFNEVETSLFSLSSRLSVLCNSIQYLYDKDIADDTLLDEEGDVVNERDKEHSMGIINDSYTEGESGYVANEYCPVFSVK